MAVLYIVIALHRAGLHIHSMTSTTSPLYIVVFITTPDNLLIVIVTRTR